MGIKANHPDKGNAKIVFHYPNFDIKYKSLRCKDMNNQDKYTYTVDEVIKRFFKKEKGELTRRNFPKYGGQVDNNKEENSGTDCSSLKSKAFLTANKAFCSVLRITSPLANFYTKIC